VVWCGRLETLSRNSRHRRNIHLASPRAPSSFMFTWYLRGLILAILSHCCRHRSFTYYLVSGCEWADATHFERRHPLKPLHSHIISRMHSPNSISERSRVVLIHLLSTPRDETLTLQQTSRPAAAYSLRCATSLWRDTASADVYTTGITLICVEIMGRAAIRFKSAPC
jgi:hypothetical protein